MDHFRKILDAIAMQNDKDGSLGSDGETSDYQRSTPSPQDSNARITELSEGNNFDEKIMRWIHDYYLTSSHQTASV